MLFIIGFIVVMGGVNIIEMYPGDAGLLYGSLVALLGLLAMGAYVILLQEGGNNDAE